MAKSKGEDMLDKACRAKPKRKAKRGLVADAVSAYTGATKGLQNIGKGIRNNVSSALATDKASLASMKNPDGSFAFHPMSLAAKNRKRKAAKPKK